MPEQPIGSPSPLSDQANVQMDKVDKQDDESLEYAYALLARSPLPAVDVAEEI